MKLWKVAAVIVAAGAALTCGGGGGTRVLDPDPGPGGGTLTAPALSSPANDEQVHTLRPTLTVTNVTSTGSGAKTYEFQISDTETFTASTTSHVGGFAATIGVTAVAEGSGGTTSWAPTTDLQPATVFYWRARAIQGSSTGAWSATGRFRSRVVGFNRNGELFDPLVHGDTLGTVVGSTTFLEGEGLRINNDASWVRYQLAETITKGEISVEVKGLRPNTARDKSRIFSMMDGTFRLFDSRFLFNVQYRGLSGNPNNAISYKVLMGDDDLKYEPTFSQRSAGVRSLNPDTTYLWTATWGSTFRLVVRRSSNNELVYERSQSTPGTYNPSPHRAYLGATDHDVEGGSYAGAIYKNFWVGRNARPATLGNALTKID